MYYLIQGKLINLLFLMLSQIKEIVKKSRACLPYGIVFTLIFPEFGVDCSGEDARKLPHTNRYNEQSLYHIGYSKVDDRWVYKAFGQGVTALDSLDDDEDGDNGEEDEECHSPPATPPTTTTQATPPTARPSTQLGA